MATWHEKYKNEQQSLFKAPSDSYEVWRKAGIGSGFSELSRFFFAKFTERYLNYFLEREASAYLSNIANRESFSKQIAKHAYETSKITQSFSAGWFNKNASEGLPSEKEVKGFFSYALGKVRDELAREGGQDGL